MEREPLVRVGRVGVGSEIGGVAAVRARAEAGRRELKRARGLFTEPGSSMNPSRALRRWARTFLAPRSSRRGDPRRPVPAAMGDSGRAVRRQALRFPSRFANSAVRQIKRENPLWTRDPNHFANDPEAGLRTGGRRKRNSGRARRIGWTGRALPTTYCRPDSSI